MRRKLALLVLFGVAVGGAYDSYLSAKQKLDLIEEGRLRTGARVNLTYPELDAWVAHEMPDGVRNPKVVVSTYGVATGSAVPVDQPGMGQFQTPRTPGRSTRR